MALGLKQIETRAWRPSGAAVGVPFSLAIHAAKAWKRDQVEFCSAMRRVAPSLPNEIPLGQIVAVCRVVGFERSEVLAARVDPVEAAWGNYEVSRWGWLTEGLRPLARPVPWVGKQGFFFVPDSVIEAAL